MTSFKNELDALVKIMEKRLAPKGFPFLYSAMQNDCRGELLMEALGPNLSKLQ